MEEFKLPEIPRQKEKLSAIKKAENLYTAAKKDKRLLIPFVATIAEVFALLGIMGLLTLIRANFAWRDIDFVSFCVLLTMRAAILFLSKDVSGRARVNAFQKDDEYRTLIDAYKKEINDIDTIELDKHLREFANPERKISAYKASIQPKIDKAAEKLSRIELKLAICEKEKSRFQKWKYERLKNKKDNLQIIINEYSTRISDEYINHNIQSTRVKYEVLTVETFLGAEQDENNEPERFSINSESELKKGILRGLPVAMLISAYFALVTWENAILDHFDALTFILDILLISWHFIQGWFSIGGKVVDTMRGVLIRKTLFIKKFKNNRETI